MREKQSEEDVNKYKCRKSVVSTVDFVILHFGESHTHKHIFMNWFNYEQCINIIKMLFNVVFYRFENI